MEKAKAVLAKVLQLIDEHPRIAIAAVVAAAVVMAM